MSFPRFKYYPDTIGSSPSWQFFRCLSFTPTSSTSTSTWRLCLRCAIFHLRKFLGRSAFRPLELVHLFFLVFGQFPSYLSISFQSIQSVLVTSAFMMVVSFILIPNPVCSLWVAFSIMSIEVSGLMMMMIYMLMMMTMMTIMTMIILISILYNISTSYPIA